jgi:sugar lactone lactonase YvrE
MDTSRKPVPFLSAILLVLTLASGCQEAGPAHLLEPSEGIAQAPPLWSATPTVETLTQYSAAMGQLPEGIAINQKGEIFVGMVPLGQIWRLDADGSFQHVFASFDLQPGDLGVLGLKWTPPGILYAAVVSSDAAVNGIWRIHSDGTKQHVPGTGQMALPNGMTVDSQGNVYVTDSIVGAVWRITPKGMASLWKQDTLLEGTGAFGIGFPIGANGIVFQPGMRKAGNRGAPARGTILVANMEVGRVIGIPVLPDGNAGEASIVLADEELVGLDGLELDARGSLYGALNVQNRVVRIDLASGHIHTIAAGDSFDFPASLVFGSGRNNHVLYVTNAALANEVDPAPSLVRIRVGPPGQNR